MVHGIELFPDKNEAILSINPKVFPLEVVYAACYVLLDRAYFILDGDPQKEIKILIKPKEEALSRKKLESLALKLHDELINYAAYAIQAARNQPIREAIIKRALATNLTENYCPQCAEEENIKEKAADIKMPTDDLFIDDPEGIAKPWTPEKAKGLKKPKG
ncbi:MAG: hypothetical protein N3F05_00635 [Candidatus Diapherotrites archaeon]|nr:hypothetical protein [Candidatus Diapherotrites archaeon]